MLFHPLSIAILFVDLASLYFLFSALSVSIRFLLQETSDENELNRYPANLEKISSNGRLVFVLQVISFLLVLLGISLIYPPILTGIMCGTGVLQISGETGVRMLLVRAFAMLALYVWYQIDLANCELPERSLNLATSKAMLCCVPFVFLSVWLGAATLWALYLGQGGDCCTLAYGGAAPSGGFLFNPVTWLPILAVISIIALVLALQAGSQRQFSQKMGLFFLSIAVTWCFVASICLLYFFSAYYYGVTQHHCLWCLFLPGNYSVGYLFFFVLAIMLSQAISVFVHVRLISFQVSLSGWAELKVRRSGYLIIAGMISYFLLTLVPLLFWKIKHGVWAV